MKSILILTDDINNSNLKKILESLEFKFNIYINNLELNNLDFIIFYNYSNISLDLVNNLKKKCLNILTNYQFNNLTVFDDDNLFYYLIKDEFNLKIEKKNIKEYGDLYKYSVYFNCDSSELSNITKKVYCINLIHRNNKFYNSLVKFKKYNINVEIIRVKHLKESKEFMNKFNKIKSYACFDINNPGEYGCKISHLICLKDAKLNNYQNIIIFEDDVIFKKDFNKKIKELKYLFDENKFIYLGSTNFNWNNTIIKKNYMRSSFTFGTFGLFIKNDLFDKIIELNTKFNNKVDITLMKLKKEDKIILYPNLVIADVKISDIRPGLILNNYCKKSRWNLELYDLN